MSYSTEFLDCFLNVQHAGCLSSGVVYTTAHYAKQSFMSAELFIELQGEYIKQAAFHAATTPVLIASAEYICRWCEGKDLSECRDLSVDTILLALGLPKVYSHVVRIIVRLLNQILEEATIDNA